MFPSPLLFLFCKGDLLDPGRTFSYIICSMELGGSIHVFPYSSNWYPQLKSSCVWRAGRAWTLSWFHLFYLQSIGKGLPQAAPPGRLGHHNQTNAIRPHHGLGLLRPQALPLSEEELQRHPKEGSPHLQVLDLLGESPGLRSPKR